MIVTFGLDWQQKEASLGRYESELREGEDPAYVPQRGDIDWEKISILASIGTVLIGYGSGDTIGWKVSAEIRRLRIEEITCQPEAAGDHHLQSKAFMRRSDKGRCRCGCILLNCFAVAFKKDRYYETA